MANLKSLPDKGERLLKQVQELEAALSSLNLQKEDHVKEGKLVHSQLEGMFHLFRKTFFSFITKFTEFYFRFLNWVIGLWILMDFGRLGGAFPVSGLAIHLQLWSRKRL